MCHSPLTHMSKAQFFDIYHQWRSHGRELGGRVPPTCPKDRLWDSSRSDEKLVRLVGGYHFKMSASEYLRCAPKYTISRLNNQNSAPYPPRHLRRLASRAFGARPPHSKILATPLQIWCQKTSSTAASTKHSRGQVCVWKILSILK